MGSTRNIELFDNTAGPAKDFSGKGYDFVATCHAENMWNNSIETYSLLNVEIASPAGKLVDIRWIHLDHSIEKGKCVIVNCPGIVNMTRGPCVVDFIAEAALLIRVDCELKKYPTQGSDSGLMSRSQQRAINCRST